jgi:hypothetical protein
MGMPVKTMSPKAKGFYGYITGVREKYPPLQFDESQDAIQTLVRDEHIKGNHECISGCLGCLAKQAELRFHTCKTRCAACKLARVTNATIWWKARQAQYDFEEITLSVSIGQPIAAEMSILHVRPVE